MRLFPISTPSHTHPTIRPYTASPPVLPPHELAGLSSETSPALSVVETCRVDDHTAQPALLGDCTPARPHICLQLAAHAACTPHRAFSWFRRWFSCMGSAQTTCLHGNRAAAARRPLLPAAPGRRSRTSREYTCCARRGTWAPVRAHAAVGATAPAPAPERSIPPACVRACVRACAALRCARRWNDVRWLLEQRRRPPRLRS